MRHCVIALEGDFSKTPFIQLMQFLSSLHEKDIPEVSLIWSDVRPEQFDFLELWFSKMKDWEALHKFQVKVSVVGDWISLPDRVVKRMKEAIRSTQDYDRFFLNFFVNYNMQYDVVQAFQILSRHVLGGRIEVSNLRPAQVREQLGVSGIVPPDRIIITSSKVPLLWDVESADVKSCGKKWENLDDGLARFI